MEKEGGREGKMDAEQRGGGGGLLYVNEGEVEAKMERVKPSKREE